MAVETGERVDPVADALEDVATAANRVAQDQRRIAGAARTMARQHRRGRSWTELADDGGGRRLLALMRESTALLGTAARNLQRGLVRALAGEGLTTREIGRRFGVSHQRISSLMSRRDG